MSLSGQIILPGSECDLRMQVREAALNTRKSGLTRSVSLMMIFICPRRNNKMVSRITVVPRARGSAGAGAPRRERVYTLLSRGVGSLPLASRGIVFLEAQVGKCLRVRRGHAEE